MSSLADLITAGLYPDDHSLSLSDRMMMYFARIHVGEGSPEGEVTADVGSSYTDIETGIEYRKVSGTEATGWVQVPDLSDSIEREGKWPSGSYIFNEGATTTMAMPVDRVIYSPIWVPEPMNAVEIAAESTTPAVGGVPLLRFGLALPDANGRPAELIDDYGTVDSTVAAGWLTKTIDVDLERGLVWAATVSQGVVPGTNLSLRAIAGVSRFIKNTVPPVAGAATGYRQSSVSGALPNPVTPALTLTTAAPLVTLKAA